MENFWEIVKLKYPPGTEVPQLYTETTSSKRTFTILEVDEKQLHFRWGVVRHGILSRCHLEKMVNLVESGAMRQDLRTLVTDYHTIVSDERPTTACALLIDMGIIKLKE